MFVKLFVCGRNRIADVKSLYLASQEGNFEKLRILGTKSTISVMFCACNHLENATTEKLKIYNFIHIYLLILIKPYSSY